MRKLLRGEGRAPQVMITDKFGSSDAAKRDIMPGFEHRSHKGLDNCGFYLSIAKACFRHRIASRQTEFVIRDASTT